jgi:hypothetical protein
LTEFNRLTEKQKERRKQTTPKLRKKK